MQHINQKTAGAVDAIVGANIKAERARLNMSQSNLASKLGITSQQVQKYEKGTNRVGASRLAQMCEAFDVPISRLFVGIDVCDVKYPQYSPHVFSASAIIDEVPEKDRDQFIQIIRGVARSFQTPKPRAA